MDALFITLTLIASTPRIPVDYITAADYTRRAAMETPEVKRAMKNVERLSERQLKYIGMSPEDLAYFTWALPLVSRKISTKPFKNFKIGDDEWSLRPEIDYSIDDYEFNGTLVLSYTFQ